MKPLPSLTLLLLLGSGATLAQDAGDRVEERLEQRDGGG